MIAAIKILAAAAAAATPAPAPSTPARAPASAAPPPIFVVEDSSRRTVELPPVIFDIVVMAGRERLWSDSVRVNQGGVNYSQSLRQANEICPDRPLTDDAYRYAYESSQLNFSLSRRDPRKADGFSVNVRWQRALPACDGMGNRGVTIEQQVEVVPGQTLRLDGDAGLSVSLTRRSK